MASSLSLSEMIQRFFGKETFFKRAVLLNFRNAYNSKKRVIVSSLKNSKEKDRTCHILSRGLTHLLKVSQNSAH